MATTTSSSDASEGPVLSLINKRLRALRKKQNRILQMEESLSKGKTLNKEQEETLNSKHSILGAIEELDKLQQLLPSAVSEELKINKEIKNEEKMSARVDEEESVNGFVGIEETRKGFVEIDERPRRFVEVEDVREGFVGIEELLELVYFGSLFDVKTQSDYLGTMFRKVHERGCCLSYDCVTDDDEGFEELLGEGDLDLISTLGGLLIERPVDSRLSHKNALQRCVEHAKLWISNSEQPIVPHSTITYAALREKLNKIMASDYFTTTPKMTPAIEMAAAAENLKSFHVPLNGSVVPISVPIEVESSSIKDEDNEQDDGNSHKHEAFDGQFGHVEELHQDASKVESVIEAEVEDKENLQQYELQNSQELYFNEQANAPRRHHRGGRVGSYKGHHNGQGGRGRGGHQNGHSQHYEQAGKYYPRYNNNYRGRGGRGGAVGNYEPGTEGLVPFDS